MLDAVARGGANINRNQLRTSALGKSVEPKVGVNERERNAIEQERLPKSAATDHLLVEPSDRQSGD